MAYQHEGNGLHRFVDPTDDRVYLHSQFEPFDAHLVYACFDQPDLKTVFALSVDAPRSGWWSPTHGCSSVPPRARPGLALRHHPAASAPTSPRSWPAPTSRSTTATSAPTAPGSTWPGGPPLAGRAPRHRRAVRGHQAELRGLRGAVRDALPLRGPLRPAVRAGVLRRRDGEPRLRHLHRDLRLPLQGHRRDPRAPRGDDHPRDGAHVVRRPRHHALVGRPLAQRVLRHLHVGARPGRPATRWTGRG
jgi:hypothetical protein